MQTLFQNFVAIQCMGKAWVSTAHFYKTIRLWYSCALKDVIIFLYPCEWLLSKSNWSYFTKNGFLGMVFIAIVSASSLALALRNISFSALLVNLHWHQPISIHRPPVYGYYLTLTARMAAFYCKVSGIPPYLLCILFSRLAKIIRILVSTPSFVYVVYLIFQ